MPLKLRLRGGERLALNGAMIRNTGTGTAQIEVLGAAALLQDRDIMAPEQVHSALDNLYYHVQLLHLERADPQSRRRSLQEVCTAILAAADADKDVETSSIVAEVDRQVEAGDTIGALRRIQLKIGKPSAGRH